MVFTDSKTPDLPDVLNIPVSGGISEGGLIILSILLILLSLVLLAILVIWRFGNNIKNILHEVKADASTAKEQVVNNHTINLRDDLDNKAVVTEDKLDKILEELDSHRVNTNNRFDRMNDRITGIDNRLNNWKH